MLTVNPTILRQDTKIYFAPLNALSKRVNDELVAALIPNFRQELSACVHSGFVIE